MKKIALRNWKSKKKTVIQNERHAGKEQSMVNQNEDEIDKKGNILK